jgi:acetolactate synthase-1/2/3 large subunit
MKQEITGSEALLRALIHEGVDTVFGYPGGQAVPIYDALYDYQDRLNHVLVRHEQGATHAAQGYARVSGKVGVTLVTSGPGVANTITGIADAMMDSTPIVVIAGQVPATLLGTDAFQEVDVIGVTQPITKWAYQVRDSNHIAWAIARAFYIASTGRPGPVVLDIPKNAQTGTTLYQPVKIDYIRSYIPIPETDPEAIGKAARLINAAKKPLALVGQGVILGKAEKELLAFLQKADIPAASTVLGLSALPSGHPLNVGMLGMHGNIAPNLKTNECDVLIAIGMRFDDRVTGNPEKYARQAKIIHLDIDAAEIDKNIRVDVPILGDAKTTLPQLTQQLNENQHTQWREEFKPLWEKEIKTVIRREIHPETGPLKMGEVVHKVSEATGHQAVLVTDVGQNQMTSVRYFIGNGDEQSRFCQDSRRLSDSWPDGGNARRIRFCYPGNAGNPRPLPARSLRRSQRTGLPHGAGRRKHYQHLIRRKITMENKTLYTITIFSKVGYNRLGGLRGIRHASRNS